MKYLLFSDLHIGEHLSYDKIINNVPESFYDVENIINQIINIVDKEHINLIIFLGDLFHNVNRLSVPIVVYTTLLFKKLSTHAPIIMLTGNHDQIYPSKLHQLTSIFIDTKNIKVVNTISQHYFYSNNINMIFLSFMKQNLLKQNMDIIFKNLIKRNSKNVLFGHFTLSKKIDSFLTKFGQDISYDNRFKIFNKIYLGHIHSPYKFDNVQYIGSCTYHNFSDSIRNYNVPYPLNVHIIDDNLNQKIIHLISPSYFLDINMKQYIADNKYKKFILNVIKNKPVYIKIYYDNSDQKKYIDEIIDHKNVRYLFMNRHVEINKQNNITTPTKIQDTNIMNYIYTFIKSDTRLSNDKKDRLINIVKELT